MATNEGALLEFPIEIIFDILAKIPNILKLKSINKKFNNVIDAFVEHNNNVLEKILPGWKDKLEQLIKILMKNDEYDKILFLYYTNINSRNLINFYAGYYDYKKLLDSNILTNYRQITNGAAYAGNLDLVRKYFSGNANEISLYAAKSGKLDIIKYAFDYNVTNKNIIAVEAARYGHISIVNYLFSNGANNYEKVANTAARYGFKNIVKSAVLHGAENFEKIAVNAVIGGHLSIAKYASRRCDPSCVELIAKTAAKYNRRDILTWAINNGAGNLKSILTAAIEGDNLEILKDYNALNVLSINEIGDLAAKYNAINIAKWILEQNRDIDLIDKMAFISSSYGNFELTFYLLSQGTTECDNILQNLAKHGKLENIIKTMEECLSKNPGNKNKYINSIAIGATLGGHYNIVLWAFENGNVDLYEVSFFAAETGNLKILEFAIKNGANDYNVIAYQAALNGRMNIIKYLIKNYKEYNFNNTIAIAAAKGGHIEILEFAIKRRVTAIKEIITSIVETRIQIISLHMAEILKRNGLMDFQILGNEAAEYGNNDLVILALRNGADLNEVAYYAALGGKLHILEELINFQADNFYQMMEGAVIGENYNIIEYLYKRGIKAKYIAYYAAKNNKINIINYAFTGCISLDDMRLIGMGAAESGNPELIDWALKNGSPYNSIIQGAARSGNINLLKDAYERNTEKLNMNEIAESAVHNDQINVLKWAYEHGANPENISIEAAKLNKIKSLLYALSIGAHNIEDIAEVAAKYNSEEILRYLLDNYKNDIDINKIALIGAQNRHYYIVRLAFKYGANNAKEIEKIATEFGELNIKSIIE